MRRHAVNKIQLIEPPQLSDHEFSSLLFHPFNNNNNGKNK